MSELESVGIESTNTSSSGLEVSQEDLTRVNEQLGESRKYRGMIGASVASNNKIAEFLNFLILEINSDQFREGIDCFYVRPDLGEIQFLGRVFCACMLPLYQQKADELLLDVEFSLDYHIGLSFHHYLYYVKAALGQETDGWKVQEEKFLIFLKSVIELRNILPEEGINIDNLNIHSLG